MDGNRNYMRWYFDFGDYSRYGLYKVSNKIIYIMYICYNWKMVSQYEYGNDMLFGEYGISNDSGYVDNADKLPKITWEINNVIYISGVIDYAISVSVIVFGVENCIQKT